MSPIPPHLTLYTIGYEGFSVDEMLKLLKQEGISCIIDVRQLPLSRKKGFSKKALMESAQNSGISYRHLVALGCPKPIRYRYKDNKDWAEYTLAYLKYLDNQAETLESLLKYVIDEHCVLLCYEADVKTCHRLYVANALVNMHPRMQVAHLNRTNLQIPIAVAAD